MTFADFNARAVAARTQLFGVTLVFKGKEVTGMVSGNSTKRALEDGGFKFDTPTVIRVPITAGIAPRIGEKITVKSTGVEFLIDEVTTHPINPELKLTVVSTQI